MQMSCRTILGDRGPFQERVDVFEINPEIDFLLARTDQGNLRHRSSHALFY